MTMNILVIGGGKVGSYLASMLMNEGHRVKVVEGRQEAVTRLQQELPPEVVVCGNGTDPGVLEAAGIRDANVVAAVTGDDEVNLVITSLARFEFGVPRVIGRVNNPKNAWMFTPEMGVDVALNQADLIARLIAEEMSLGDMMTLLKLRKGQFSLVEEKVHPTSSANGKAIHDLELPPQCVFAAIIRKGELIIPRGDTILQPVDEVLAVVHTAELPRLAAVLGPAT
jgi:trk system potassium uptake protein TrkA